MSRSPLANWNGDEMPLEDVKVSVLDRAFLFGDAVYEVIRIYQSRLFRLNDHLDRLSGSLASLAIPGVDMPSVLARVESTVAHSEIAQGLAYLQITRGQGVRHHFYSSGMTPNILIYAEEFIDPYTREREQGATAVTHPDIRWARNDIKSTSLAANCMAAEYARAHGCPDVIFIDSNALVTEGSHTSVFAVKEGRIIVAPSSANVLPGITKRQVLDLASASNIPVVEGRVSANDLSAVDEMFFAGTPEEILPIVRVNDHAIGTGQPGPIVKTLQSEFKRALDQWLSTVTNAG